VTVRGKILWGPWEGTFKKELMGYGQKEVAIVFKKEKRDSVPLTVETDSIKVGFYTGKPDKKYIVIGVDWKKR